jgi:hypothetical protein
VSTYSGSNEEANAKDMRWRERAESAAHRCLRTAARW